MVTVVSAVFSETQGKVAPAAVTGYKFNQTALYNMVFKNKALKGPIRVTKVYLALTSNELHYFPVRFV